MKSLLSVILLGVFSLSMLSISTGAQSPQENFDNKWRLVWSDEFEHPVIDKTKWSHDIDCWGGGNKERQCYTDFQENSFVKDGKLNISAHIDPATGPALPPHLRKTKEDKTKTKTQPFTSARLTSKNKGDWRYGRVEVRAKLPEGQGTWPAIWMLPTDNVYGEWAMSGEIDIVEAVNLGAYCKICDSKKENNILGTIHYGAKWPKNTFKNGISPLPESSDGYHIFAIEWSQGEIKWYVDNQEYFSRTSKKWYTKSRLRKTNKHAPFDQRFHLIVNLAIGGDLPEQFNEGGVSLKGYPKTMLVDWVRVYECKADPENGLLCQNE